MQDSHSAKCACVVFLLFMDLNLEKKCNFCIYGKHENNTEKCIMCKESSSFRLANEIM